MGVIDRRTLLQSSMAAWITSSRDRTFLPFDQADLAAGTFQPTESSLLQHRTPSWFRDAKFGFTAQWTPQSVPEQGDWYARNMYRQGTEQYQHHLEHYGHPSRVGYKDLCRSWAGANWNPAELLDLYQRAGARYFVALANHHDGFDCWNSRFQPWNSAAMGPKRDIIGNWKTLAHERGLRFGAEVFSAQNWDWFQVSYDSDTTGLLAGVPYDGNLIARDGAGTWWNGLDPAMLYGSRHSKDAPPSAAYAQNFFDRTADLLHRYEPDLIFYTDPGLPLGDVGLRLATLQFNLNRRGDAVLCTKKVPIHLRESLVCDMLPADTLEAAPWQMDICIGDWHYKQGMPYKTPSDVIPYLVDVVSKNGNLLLNIPIRADGTIDDRERAIVEEIGQWMHFYGEAIYETRPWQIFGEGPTRTQPVDFPYRTITYTVGDIRFTCKGDTLYAVALGVPSSGSLLIRSLGRSSNRLPHDPVSIEMLGAKDRLPWKRDDHGISITLPRHLPFPYACAVRIRMA
jgi:alpha-L-fucosidase